MSAIAGILSHESAGKAILPEMLDKMEHRGEEHQQYFYHEGAAIGLGNAGLTGLTGMEQALVSEDQRLTLICDGDMGQLQHHQHKTLLDEYRRSGIDFVRRLSGSFALLIWDERGETPVFYAARDMLGSKPLYYAKQADTLLFSSEMKSLTNYHKTVHPFPPGYYYQSGKGFVRFDGVKPAKIKIEAMEQNQRAVIDEIQKRLNRAVKHSLEGEQTVGLMISGGLDSSLLAALAKKMDGRPRKSFCVGSASSSDLPAAREVAKVLGTEHYEYEYDLDEMLEALPHVIYHLESFEPSLVRSAVPNYFAFQMAAQHVDLVLSGEGADELFSGYAYLKEIQDPEELDQELIRVINSLHHIGLQRGDRMSAANGIEVRTPFLDKDLMAYALTIPVAWKLRQTDHRMIEKWILRKAYDGVTDLPRHILWRDKEEFSEGSGAKDCLTGFMAQSIDHEEYEQAVREIANNDKIGIRSKEELYYYRIFKSFYPQPELAQQVGRWADW